MSVTVDEARRLILESVRPQRAIERVQLADALGRVLAVDCASDVDVPGADNSAMDGYAVRAADLAGSCEERPVRLHVTGVLPAGKISDVPVGAGEAVRIFTGAPMPAGADTVVMQEYTRAIPDEDAVLIQRADPVGKNVRRRGEDVRTGSAVLSEGTLVRPQELGVLASAGHAEVDVLVPPRATIISTGSELIDVADTPHPGQVRNSNAFTLSGLVRQAGATVAACTTVTDDPDAIAGLIETGAGDSEVIITSGGVSVGDYDFVMDCLDRLGWRKLFYKVLVKPGHPMTAGLVGDALFFGLPGNPVSVMTSFLQFVAPAIRRMLHQQACLPVQLSCVLSGSYKGKGNRQHLVPCTLTPRKDGRWGADVEGPHGSGILTSLTRAHGLVVVPSGVRRIEAGTDVPVQLLPGDLYAQNES